LRRVDQSAPLNHDLLSEQLRVFAMAKDAALSAKINETAPGKLGFGESRTSLNPAKSRVPGNVAIALIAFLAGAAVSSMVWLNDWKLSQTESPPPTAVALLGPGESEKQEPRLAAADDPCAPGCMPQAGLDATLPRESLLSTHSEHSNDSGSGTGLSESFEGPTADGSKAPLPVSFARYIPEGGEQLALPPLPPEKPKAQKHAAAKSHPKSAVIPPRRPQMQSASLFSQVSDYLARILPKL
jgi:hypothetical protein